MEKRLQSRKVCIFAADLFEDMELLYPLFRLREEGAQVDVVGMGADGCRGKNGLSIDTDRHARDVSADEYDGVVVPGGYCPDKLRTDQHVLKIVRDANQAGKPVAAICHAAWVPVSAGIVEGRRMTCFWSVQDDVRNAGADYVDEDVVVDGNLITSRYPPDLGAFCRALISALEGG